MRTVHYFILNLFLAILWILLNREASVFQFLLGFAIGLLILWASQFLLQTTGYVHKVKGFIRFVFSFARLFFIANLSMVKIILFTPKDKINPSFLSYPIEDLSRFEALLLSQFISLTPGSVSVKFKKPHLWVHLIDLKDKEKAMNSIDELKELILGFTR